MQKVLEDLAAVIGNANAFEIVRRWSGRELYVPEKMTPEHPLALTIGQDAAMKLSATLPCCRLRIPMEKHALRTMREEAIFREKDVLGHSYTEIADKWGMTRQAVTVIVAKKRAESRVEGG